MNVLAMDTSNQTMAVAVIQEKKMLGQIQTTVNKNHSKSLMPAIETLMKEISINPQELNRIVVAEGPGSYTGLRIGVTTAKTLADTLNLDLVGISSLKVIAANCIDRAELIVPIFDARRKNVYAGGYQWRDGQLTQVMEDQHISLSELLIKLKDKQVYFVGADVQNFTEEIQNELPQAIINQQIIWNYPNGVTLAELGLAATPTDIHTFLPRYLKRVEAEEKWLETHELGEESYVEKI